MKITEK